jgi:hypothetical protein
MRLDALSRPANVFNGWGRFRHDLTLFFDWNGTASRSLAKQSRSCHFT